MWLAKNQLIYFYSTKHFERGNEHDYEHKSVNQQGTLA